MYFITLLIFLFTPSMSMNIKKRSPPLPAIKNENRSWNVTYDCLLNNKREYTASIWSAEFPENIYSLTIQNCNYLVLNINVVNKKRNFTRLIVLNVENCEITASPNVKGEFSTAMPCHTVIANVNSLNIAVPLFVDCRDNNIEGSLQFNNVTISKLKSGTIKRSHPSMETLSMAKVNVALAEENAISFHGYPGSTMRIENSFFFYVPENFIFCNVTNLIIKKNIFGNVRRGSFSATTKVFDFSGNSVGVMENFAFNIDASQALIRDNKFDLVKKYSFRGVFTNSCPYDDKLIKFHNNKVGRIADEKYLSSDQSSKTSSEVASDNREVNKGSGKIMWRTWDHKPRRESMSLLMSHLGYKFFLLWFLAVLTMILVFPVAYLVKIFLCRSIDKAFPPVIKHQHLVNES